MARKAVRILVGAIAAVTGLGFATLTTVDRSPVQAQEFFQETLTRLETTPWSSSSGNGWRGGWSSAPVIPDHPLPLVGYAARGPYEFIQDPSLIKVLTLSNGTTQLAWINFELLIVHPALARAVEAAVRAEGLQVDQLVFTATHTHSGMGGYIPGLLGRLAFGGYDEKTVELLARTGVAALRTALARQQPVSLTFSRTNAGQLVSNRFVRNGPTDPFVRQLTLTTKDGRRAALLTYSAHATCLKPSFKGLSGDYPKYLTQRMEARGYAFAMYAAGTVGSHRPACEGGTPDGVQAYSAKLDALLESDASPPLPVPGSTIRHSSLRISLREPHLRLSNNVRLRPWLASRLTDGSNPHLDITLVGNVLFLASSGELSGVFYSEWDRLARSLGLELIITTFNGGYIGYVTPDELYDEPFHEVRTMNWFGPGNGAYFSRLVSGVLEKASR